GLDDPPCRWLLAYRRESHGRVVAWLDDVLRDARVLGLQDIATLPHDLADAGRFTDWPLKMLAKPPPNTDDPIEATTRVFLEVIEKPLRLQRYPWVFAAGHAERLARAFAEARIERPDTPLVPELQVVLAHLLAGAEARNDGSTTLVEVPEDPHDLIDDALKEHLRRVLDLVYPPGTDRAARTARARALLVLRELAGVHGRHERGLGADELTRALGEDGEEVLAACATARTRLVIRERRGDTWVYVLAHDRLAEVLVRVFDAGDWLGLEVDTDLLALRRFVALQNQLYHSGDMEQSTVVTPTFYNKIEQNGEVLLWSERQREWWRACRNRLRVKQRHVLLRRVAATFVIATVAISAWAFAAQRSQYRALLEDVASGRPETAFAAIDALLDRDAEPAAIRARLTQRELPFDVFEQGLGGVAPSDRAEALIRAAKVALPLLESRSEDPVMIASVVWALDFFAATFAAEARDLKDAALATLRIQYPPPPRPTTTDPLWVTVPAGTYWMGAHPDDLRDEPDMTDEHPRHQVRVSAFQMMRREVTNSEFRRLFPTHSGPQPDSDDLPTSALSWYQAYTYAAWLGGRLPTEAEWEHAARSRCAHQFCDRHGEPTSIDEVAWWAGNSWDRSTGYPSRQPVMTREANPLGIFDLHGNVWEWTSNWYEPYPRESVADPPGPTRVVSDERIVRGGSAWRRRGAIIASERLAAVPSTYSVSIGFRVVMPFDDAPKTGQAPSHTHHPRVASLTAGPCARVPAILSN
ncbi:MAG: SUMF1/EgtB/PvdO family nonheme iron enzyme, partial [Acidobacteriota bacterium]